MLITRPMLAETLVNPNLVNPNKNQSLLKVDLNSINFPILASPKLDGIRCILPSGKPLSRKFKEIPNKHINSSLSNTESLVGCDGELITFTNGKPDDFNTIQSKVMREEGTPEFSLFVFDKVSESLAEPYYKRYNNLQTTRWPVVGKLDYNKYMISILEHVQINSVEELLLFEEKAISQGFEGIMIRSLDGQYKLGRSTLKQGWLLKLKRFEDSEAVVLEINEQFTNTNSKETDELGLSKRSSKLEGMVPANTLGEFVVRDIKTNKTFKIGTGLGLSKELRQEIWDSKEKYIGKIVKYKHQPSGAKEDGNPRFPVWLGFRHENDMD